MARLAKPDALKDPRVVARKPKNLPGLTLYHCRKCDKVLISAHTDSLFGGGLNLLDIAMVDDHYKDLHG